MNRILTTRNKSAPTPGARFLGVQLTVELNSYLALFSAAEETSKSNVVRELITQWINRFKKEGVDDACTIIAEKAYGTWLDIPGKKDWQEFQYQLVEELAKKGIKVDLINRILLILENGTEHKTSHSLESPNGSQG